MSRRKIRTENAPLPVGPYSQAIEIDGWVHVAGQIPLNPETGEMVEGDIAAQGRQVLTNLQAVVEAAGGSLNDVVKTTVYITEMADFPALNEVYAEFFDGDFPPARATIAAKELPKGCKVEIDAVARIG